MKLNSRRTLAVLAISIALLFSFSLKKDYFEISKQLSIFSSLYKELNLFYVDDTDPAKLMNSAINSMLSELDPYTTFLNEEDSEDLDIQTSGEYAGIGATVRNINGNSTFIEIYRGSPADKSGIIAGDIIYEIQGQRILNMDPQASSKLLKGAQNTNVLVTIMRDGSKIDKILTREKIKIESVPYYGMLEKNTGYILLNSFTRTSGEDVAKALIQLKKMKAEKIILDLRSNPGGLLSEAVKISNLFVEKGNSIVETRGRIKDWNNIFYAQEKAVDNKIPVAVLVNSNSASASEIVAGALQDLDRAVIVGEKTYGKGLVQQPRPLEYGTKLKITIAKYYTPSGRCIQSKDYFDRDTDGKPSSTPDSLRAVFKTRNGRLVYDANGIDPDIKVLQPKYSEITQELLRSNMIFLYGIHLQKRYTSNQNIIVGIEELEDFKNFVKKNNYTYKNQLEKNISTLIKENDKQSNELKREFDRLLIAASQQSENEYKLHWNEIAKEIEMEIFQNRNYRQGRITEALKTDGTVSRAIELLSDEKTYRKILNI